MSRCGRVQEFLDEWKAHPADCTDKHDAWMEESGGHGLDAWDVAQLVDQIDPFFHYDTERRLRAAILSLPGGAEVLETMRTEPIDALHTYSDLAEQYQREAREKGEPDPLRERDEDDQ